MHASAQLTFSTLTQSRISCLGNGASHSRQICLSQLTESRHSSSGILRSPSNVSVDFANLTINKDNEFAANGMSKREAIYIICHGCHRETFCFL